MKINVKKIAAFTGHKDCIYTLSRSGRHEKIYSAGGDGMVVEWDIGNKESGKVVAKVDASVYALHYISELDTLIIGQNYEGIHLVNAGDQQVLGSLKITESPIFDIKNHKNLLYIGTGDGNLFVVDVRDLSIVKQLKLSIQSLRSIAVNPHTNEIAAAFSDNYIRVLDIKSMKLKYHFPAHANSVFTVYYTESGEVLMSGGRDAHLKGWHAMDNYAPLNDIVAHMYAINNIAYRPDQKYFATASMDKTLKIWDAEQYKLLKVIDHARHGGHRTSVNKLLWSGDNRYLFSGSDDRSVLAWDLEFKDE